MAHRKAGGSTQYGRDSVSKRLGVKVSNDQVADPGNVILRQRGTKFHPGKNVKRGKDDTLLALKKGRVRFIKKKIRKFHGKLKPATVVDIV